MCIRDREADLSRRLTELKALRIQSSKRQFQEILQVYAGAGAAEQNQLLKSLLYGVCYQKARGSTPEDFSLEIYHRSFYPEL